MLRRMTSIVPRQIGGLRHLKSESLFRTDDSKTRSHEIGEKRRTET